MRKGHDGGEKGGGEGEKRMMKIVATTSLPAVRLPERRPTGTPYACAHYEMYNRSERRQFFASSNKF